jgi:fluoroquinolone transport system permease protein
MIIPFSPRRLSATVRQDVVLQFRNGFYYAAAFIVVLYGLLLTQLPEPYRGRLLPILVLSNLVISTFYFIAGLVLLEKKEGTLEPQIVTPLRKWEYLVAKVISLAGLALVENLLIVGLATGFRFGVLSMAVGTLLAAALYILLGFIAVARYDSINEYLFPSFLYAAFFVLPVLNYLGITPNGLFYLHPLQAPLVLMQAAFQPIQPWQWIYGVLYAGVWIGLVFAASQRAFHRFVVLKEGVN